MARDPGLEELVRSALNGQRGITEKAMFGGWAFLLNGSLLCGARIDSLMLRVGPDNESWALKVPGVVPVVMRGHTMKGYVRATPEAYADDAACQRLMDAAVGFTSTLAESANLSRKRLRRRGTSASSGVTTPVSATS